MDATRRRIIGMNVPMIDIEPLRRGVHDPDAIAAMARAGAEHGFFRVTGHGITRPVIDRLYEESRRFFEQPLERKQLVAPPHPGYARGYKAIGFEALAYSSDATNSDRPQEAASGPTDLKEFYHFGPADWPHNDLYYRAGEGRYFFDNLWPADQPQFAAAADDYYRGMESLAGSVCQLAALALDLPAHYFAPMIDRHITAARINYYPRQPNPPAPGQLRAGAHTDFDMFTILSGEDVPGGLQVMARNGQWFDVHTDRYEMVCNIGDLMMRWTGDRWCSNRHRVLNPPRAVAAASSRISIGFFFHPNYDASIESLPGQPVRYPPVLSGEFRDEKYRVTQAQAKG